MALVTNCDLSLELFQLLDVIVPIHPADILRSASPQFQTRMLYNIDPPFAISLVMDAHVLFCQSGDLEEAFQLFRESDVELAYSTRILDGWVTSGCAAFFRRSPATRVFWERVTRAMNDETTAGDDQYFMNVIANEMRGRGEIRFRWLSNNFFFATHGVDPQGKFVAKADCYRSSVLVSGRVRFIHGRENQCVLINGSSNQYITRTRTVYIPGTQCEGTYDHSKLVFSQEEFQSLVGTNTAPAFDWNLLQNEDPNGLFWYDNH